jgi:sensor c-di-GMP phosphodiesterase-like protein
MTEHEASAEIVGTIMKLAQNLGMEVVAEGVETEHQRDKLKALECEFGQGYHFAKPMGKDAAEAFYLRGLQQAATLQEVKERNTTLSLTTTAAPQLEHGNSAALHF